MCDYGILVRVKKGESMKYVVAPVNLRWLNGWCKTFLGDVKVFLRGDGWYVGQKELAGIGLVHLKMGDLVVEDFVEDVSIAWDTVNMKDFLDGVGDDKLHIRLENGMLYIDTEEIERKMTLVDQSNLVTAKKPNIDRLLVAGTDIDLAKLKRAIKSAEKLSDHATIECDDGVFKIRALKETGDEVTLKTPMVGDTTPEDCKSDFSLDYLKMISGLLQGEVNIRFGTACPILFHDVVSEHSYADFYLAPRIESD